MVEVGWTWWEQGGYDLVGLDTGYLVSCFRKESQKRSGSRSGYRVYLHLFISPLKTEFSLYSVPLPFGVFFFNFPRVSGRHPVCECVVCIEACYQSKDTTGDPVPVGQRSVPVNHFTG